MHVIKRITYIRVFILVIDFSFPTKKRGFLNPRFIVVFPIYLPAEKEP